MSDPETFEGQMCPNILLLDYSPDNSPKTGICERQVPWYRVERSIKPFSLPLIRLKLTSIDFENRQKINFSWMTNYV